MAAIFIKCPNPDCGGELQVASAVGLEKKKTSCPLCNRSYTIGDYLPKFSLNVDGKNYQLHFGRQWVGRRKAGNDAEVQIPDETMYMSKKHAIIELTCTQAGVECTFEEHGKNPTGRDGIKLVKDDIVYLNINDCLTLGGKKMFLAAEFAKPDDAE